MDYTVDGETALAHVTRLYEAKLADLQERAFGKHASPTEDDCEWLAGGIDDTKRKLRALGAFAEVRLEWDALDRQISRLMEARDALERKAGLGNGVLACDYRCARRGELQAV